MIGGSHGVEARMCWLQDLTARLKYDQNLDHRNLPPLAASTEQSLYDKNRRMTLAENAQTPFGKRKSAKCPIHEGLNTDRGRVRTYHAEQLSIVTLERLAGREEKDLLRGMTMRRRQMSPNEKSRCRMVQMIEFE